MALVSAEAVSAFNEYREAVGLYDAAAVEFSARIERAIGRTAVRPVVVTARPKDPVEFFKKQSRKNYENPWRDCPDLVGVRVVVSLASDKKQTVESLFEFGGFANVDVEDQAIGADPLRLDYRGLHVHLLAEDLLGVDGVPIPCELQIRTVAEHSWAETEHKFVYKKSDHLAPEVQRIFRRLLALVELFDDELDRGVAMIAATEEFGRLRLLRFLETEFANLAGTLGDEHLSREVLAILAEAGYSNSEELRVVVSDYLSGHRGDVESLLASHGSSSPTFEVDRHWLLSQPELLLFVALMKTDEYRLATALAGYDLFQYVEPIALWTDSPGFGE